MKECKICGKSDISNLGAHVRGKHNMSMKEYEDFEVPENLDTTSDEVFDDDPVVEQKAESTNSDRMKKIFNVQEPDTQRTLQSFLDEFVIDEKTLREIVSSYKKDSRVSVTSSLKNKIDWAKTSVSKYKDNEFVDVHDVFLAEELVKEHGFKVLTVKSGNPKTWKLQKI